MKISLNWLKKYVDINISTDELVKLIGARLVEIEEVIDQTHKYDNIFVAKVVECEKIPETHLSLCQIDIGEARTTLSRDVLIARKGSPSSPLVQVVCGAPNVHKGMLAAWIAPGATVPASSNQDAPFVIGTRKLRGYDSSGMLAGADELDFGTVHESIVELDPKTAKPGDKFADLFDLNDIILDVENKPLTRRPDTFGIIGFAREIAGILGQPFKTPDFIINKTSDFILSGGEKLDINITDPDLCPRYTALIMERKDDAKSKYLTELDTLISRSGMRPIDPIVDMTNYLMLLTGQPLHAFDYDKFVKVGKSQTPKVIVRAAKPNEKLALLDGREVQCTENDILITSNNIPVALAGAMGAANTVIDETTKKIIIESATFSLYNLRKTQMQHGIFSEAITRFTKGQPAGGTLPVAKEFATLTAHQLKPLALFDEYPKPAKPTVVKITTQDINSLLGTDYAVDVIRQTLENVGFVVTVKNDVISDLPQSRRGQSDEARDGGPEERVRNNSVFTVTTPYWRTDIHIKEDIIEEVGRLLGYDSITSTVPPTYTAYKNPLFTLKTQIRNTLSAAGANEVLTYSFISENLIEKVGQDPKNSYKIINSLSPDLQYVRQQILPNLFEKAHDNIKDGYERFALFEMNQVFWKSEGLTNEKVPVQFDNLGVVFVDTNSTAPGYYTAKLYAETLARQIGLTIKFIPRTKPFKVETYFEPKRSADLFVNDTYIGNVAELKNSIAAKFKLPSSTGVIEIGLDLLLPLLGNTKTSFQASDFPFVKRDLTLTVPESTPYQTVVVAIQKVLTSQGLIFTIAPLAIYQPKGKTTKNLSFHLEFAHPDKTLDSKQINAIIKQLEQIK
ncbi:phenylalanine--tRNA ligase subunit beta [Candidatus Saccharibacteria bacterium]|nr:phenylalanine--tRNA ligase subunit beta [Candidatus Saccharibacteria bacterium]